MGVCPPLPACAPRTFSSVFSSAWPTFTPRPPCPLLPLLPLPLATNLSPRNLGSEPNAVRVTVAVRTGVEVALGDVGLQLAEDDHSGGAAVDAQRAPRADVFVDDERDVVARVLAGLFGVDRVADRAHRHHVDALPRADVDAVLAEDALRLVDVQELLRLHRRGEVRRGDLLQLVVGGEVGHGRVGVGTGHQASPPFVDAPTDTGSAG